MLGPRPGRLAGKVALVTGGGSGIGRACCEVFAAEEASVVVGGLPPGDLQDVVQAIAAAGGTAVAAAGDVRDAGAAAAMVDAAVNRFGRLDVLVNNAGVAYVGSLETMPEADWDRVIDTNLKSIYLLSRAALPHLAASGAGAIVNTASQLGFVAAPNFSAYCASKGGVVNLTRAMALELADRHIRVNALCPGAVETPLLVNQFAAGHGPQGSLEDLANMHALKRLAQPMELAYPALFLACDESSFMTGAALVVDGGYCAA